MKARRNSDEYISDSESEDYEDEKLDKIGSLKSKKKSGGGFLSGISSFFGGSKEKKNAKRNKKGGAKNDQNQLKANNDWGLAENEDSGSDSDSANKSLEYMDNVIKEKNCHMSMPISMSS